MGGASWVNGASQIGLALEEAAPQGKLDLRGQGSRSSLREEDGNHRLG